MDHAAISQTIERDAVGPRDLAKATAVLQRAFQEVEEQGDAAGEAEMRWLSLQVERWKRELNRVAGADSPLDPQTKDELGRWVAAQVQPIFLRSRFADRAYRKPAGFAGDYQTILLLYRREPAGIGRMGALIDGALMQHAGARAVYNRRTLLAHEIRRTAAATRPRPARVTSLACGPAQELEDVLRLRDGDAKLETTLLDMDVGALRHARGGLEALGHRPAVHERNLIKLALGKERLDLPPQDLIYSAGLIDYFDDRLVVALMDLAHDWLAPGGRLLLGNFHPRNPDRTFIEAILDWHLIHRTEADMDRLYRASKFGRGCTRVRFEEQGINLFAECVRSLAL